LVGKEIRRFVHPGSTSSPAREFAVRHFTLLRRVARRREVLCSQAAIHFETV